MHTVASAVDATCKGHKEVPQCKSHKEVLLSGVLMPISLATLAQTLLPTLANTSLRLVDLCWMT